MCKRILVLSFVLALTLALGSVALAAPTSESLTTLAAVALAAPTSESSTDVQLVVAAIACPVNSHLEWQTIIIPGFGPVAVSFCVCDAGFQLENPALIVPIPGVNACVPIPDDPPPPPLLDTDGDGIPDNQDVCPTVGDLGHGVNRHDPNYLGCPNLPPDGIANWEGNPLGPNFDGRLNYGPADPYVIYCRDDHLQIYDAHDFVTQVALSAVQNMDPAGSTMPFANVAYTVARSGEFLQTAGPPNDFRVDLLLPDCLARNAIGNPAG